jgi:hypothetical protein
MTAGLHGDVNAAALILDAADLRALAWELAGLLAGELERRHEHDGRGDPLDRIRRTTARITAEELLGRVPDPDREENPT